MISAHLCDQKCFEKLNLRNSNDNIIKCFICEKSLNTKCFNINTTVAKSHLNVVSNIVFVCSKCHSIAKNQKPTTTNRKSLNKQNSIVTRPGTPSGTSITKPNEFDELKRVLSGHTTCLNQILSTINLPSTSKQQKQYDNTDQLIRLSNSTNKIVALPSIEFTSTPSIKEGTEATHISKYNNVKHKNIHIDDKSNDSLDFNDGNSKQNDEIICKLNILLNKIDEHAKDANTFNQRKMFNTNENINELESRFRNSTIMEKISKEAIISKIIIIIIKTPILIWFRKS